MTELIVAEPESVVNEIRYPDCMIDYTEKRGCMISIQVIELNQPIQIN